MTAVIVTAAFLSLPLAALWVGFWIVLCAVNFLYEKAHFQVIDGKLTLHRVWWGKYFGYKEEPLE